MYKYTQYKIWLTLFGKMTRKCIKNNKKKLNILLENI